ncbi:MAG: ATP-grasp domain-containing protein [Methanomicrobiales archaeon]|nr:ATP-grasp domain-containing protein [Methanomicrobiales archaeon]
MITRETPGTPGIKKQAIVIVDGFATSGRVLASRFLMKGIPCIEVLSHVEFPEKYLKKNHAEDYLQDPLFEKKIVFDGEDYSSVIRALADYHVLGVIPGSEMGVIVADALSERMGLYSNGTRRSAARRNKHLMQHALIDAGVMAKQFICTHDEKDLLAWFRAGGFQEIVIKPMSSASTEGVTFCKTEEEIQHAFRELLGTTNHFGDKNTEVLAEERLFGTEFGVNTVSWNGKHRLAELWQYKKVKVEGVGNVYDCTRLCDWPGDDLKPLVEYAFRALDALGIRYGAAHTEIMLTEKGPLLIESGARIMGGTIPPDLILSCSGQCQVDLMVEAYTDPEGFTTRVDAPYHLSRHMIRKHLIARHEGTPEGEIAAIEMLAGLRSCAKGDFVNLISDWYVPRTVDMMTSPAKVFLIHDDPHVILEDYHRIRTFETSGEAEFFCVKAK